MIIAHAPLASAMRSMVAHVVPDAQDAVMAFDVEADLDVEVTRRRLQQLVISLPEDDLLVLTDVYGATPCNLAAALCRQPRVKVLAGLNLSMLWRAVAHRSAPIAELERIAMEGARQGIIRLGSTSPQNQKLPLTPDDQGHNNQSQ
ncbi:MAG: PTS sugar transporter subunit IIA [Aquabacterium sp.]